VAQVGATTVPARGALAVVASFPRGTFTQTEPILTDRWSWHRAFSAGPDELGAWAGRRANRTGG
jgi:hypothetical protein